MTIKEEISKLRKGGKSSKYSRLDQGAETSNRADIENLAEIRIDPDFTLVVLDRNGVKFRIPAHPKWPVIKFKKEAEKVHQVPASQQRLIFLGALLDDSKQLSSYKSIQNESIIHLFPKPKIVYVDEEANQTSSSDEGNTNNHAPSSIPSVTINVNNRTISSADIFEAQQRVKMLSFLLMVICMMELMTLAFLYVGGGSNDNNMAPPGDPTDFNKQNPTRKWHNTDYIDVIISSFGFMVGLWGLRASNETSLEMAKRYYRGLITTGFLWICFYYYLDVDNQKRQREAATGSDAYPNNNYDPNTNTNLSGNIYTNAMLALILPCIVWFTCFYRAWEYQNLIQEEVASIEHTTNENNNINVDGYNGASSETIAGVANNNDNNGIEGGGRMEVV